MIVIPFPLRNCKSLPTSHCKEGVGVGRKSHPASHLPFLPPPFLSSSLSPPPFASLSDGTQPPLGSSSSPWTFVPPTLCHELDRPVQGRRCSRPPGMAVRFLGPRRGDSAEGKGRAIEKAPQEGREGGPPRARDGPEPALRPRLPRRPRPPWRPVLGAPC